MNVEGKKAVVTGAGSGIGRTIVIELAARGCSVVAADVEETAAQETAQLAANGSAKTVAFACDVTSDESVNALADHAWAELGGVDILFNNAGVSGGTALLDSELRDLRWILEVNVIGVWIGCSVFGKRFRDQGTPAWIVNTGSEHSLGFAHPLLGFYTASKHAVLGMSDVMRRELPDNIGLSVLCPGVVRTGMWDAGRNRPERFGGRFESDAVGEQIMSNGKDASEIAKNVVDGVIAEEFLIVTHSQSRRYAEERWKAIAAAFDRQAPYDERDERYDVNKLIEKIFSGAE